MFSSFSNHLQKIYKETPEGNGQRWLMIDLEDNDKRYKEVRKIIGIKSK